MKIRSIRDLLKSYVGVEPELSEKMPKLMKELKTLKENNVPDLFISKLPATHNDLKCTREQGERKLSTIEFYGEHGLTLEEALSNANIVEDEYRFWRKVVHGSGSLPIDEFISNQDELQRVRKERYEKCYAAYNQLGTGEDFETEVHRIYCETARKIRDLIDL